MQRINTTENARWQAVLERDGNADFVYGVTSTRIYCRPSCPSRRPKRENARFFDSPELAAQAGFRACQRCRPDEEKTAVLSRVEHACRLIEDNLETSLSFGRIMRANRH